MPLKGYKHTEETKKKMKGRNPWNKGIKYTDKKKKNLLEKSKIFVKGYIPWNKGLKMSDEFCKKNSESHKGIKSPCKGKKRGPNPEHSERMKGRIPWNKNKKVLKISGKNHPNWKGGKLKCIDCGKQTSNYKSKRCRKCNDKYSVGKRSPLWKGGLSPVSHIIRTRAQYRLWREAVLKRDNYTCQKYGITNTKFIAHHIKNFAQYPELRFAIDNGITLSEEAHKEFHKIYGRKNNTHEQLEEYLSP